MEGRKRARKTNCAYHLTCITLKLRVLNLWALFWNPKFICHCVKHNGKLGKHGKNICDALIEPVRFFKDKLLDLSNKFRQFMEGELACKPEIIDVSHIFETYLLKELDKLLFFNYLVLLITSSYFWNCCLRLNYLIDEIRILIPLHLSIMHSLILWGSNQIKKTKYPENSQILWKFIIFSIDSAI